MARIFDNVEIVNLDDWAEKFWAHDYLITVTAQGLEFVVNAAHEQDALDELIDFFEQAGYHGLIATYQDLTEDGLKDDQIDEYICGGNHGLYLTTEHVMIKSLR
jgi:hypothetical protein